MDIQPPQTPLGRLARRRYQRGYLKLKGNSWVAAWREDVIENGVVKRKQVFRVIGYKDEYPTKSCAQRALDEILKPINALTYTALFSTTFAEFVTRWEIVLAQHKPSTQAATRSQLRRTLLPYFGKMRLTLIQSEEMQRFASGLSQYSPKTVRNVVRTLRMIWKSAHAWGYATHDPFTGIVLPKAEPKPPKTPTCEQVASIVRTAKEPWRTFFWLAAETGMRAGELCGLRWEDIDFDRHIVQVRQTVWHGRVQSPKSKAALRSFGVSARLVEHLVEQRRIQGNGSQVPFVFHTRNGTPLDANLIVRRKLHPILKQLGLPQMGLHAFRHFSASMMDAENVPLKIRQTRLGHSDPRTTLGTYTHVISDDEREYANNLGVLLQGAQVSV